MSSKWTAKKQLRMQGGVVFSLAHPPLFLSIRWVRGVRWRLVWDLGRSGAPGPKIAPIPGQFAADNSTGWRVRVDDLAQPARPRTRRV
jgi:hypothetical protein